MSVLSLSKRLTAEEIQANARQLARACRCRAEEFEQGWLKNADPRAVQGGAVCEDAQPWYAMARKFNALANEMGSDPYEE